MAIHKKPVRHIVRRKSKNGKVSVFYRGKGVKKSDKLTVTKLPRGVVYTEKKIPVSASEFVRWHNGDIDWEILDGKMETMFPENVYNKLLEMSEALPKKATTMDVIKLYRKIPGLFHKSDNVRKKALEQHVTAQQNINKKADKIKIRLFVRDAMSKQAPRMNKDREKVSEYNRMHNSLEYSKDNYRTPTIKNIPVGQSVKDVQYDAARIKKAHSEGTSLQAIERIFNIPKDRLNKIIKTKKR